MEFLLGFLSGMLQNLTRNQPHGQYTTRAVPTPDRSNTGRSNTESTDTRQIQHGQYTTAGITPRAVHYGLCGTGGVPTVYLIPRGVGTARGVDSVGATALPATVLERRPSTVHNYPLRPEEKRHLDLRAWGYTPVSEKPLAVRESGFCSRCCTCAVYMRGVYGCVNIL